MLYVAIQSNRCETYLLLGKCLVKSIGYRWDTQVKTKPRVYTKTPILVPDSILFWHLEYVFHWFKSGVWFFLKIATHISYVGNKVDRLLGVENKKVHCENNDEKNNWADLRKPGNWKWFRLEAVYIFCPPSHEAVIECQTIYRFHRKYHISLGKEI